MAKPVQVKTREPPLWFSCRLTYFVLTFFANLIVMLLRSNINFGLVCMVRPPRRRHFARQRNSTTGKNATMELGFSDENITDLLMDDDDESQDYCQTPQDSTNITFANFTNTPRAEGLDFEWDKAVQANLLAAFFYGYVFTNVVGGLIADRFGGKKSLVASVGVISSLTLLNPIAAMQGPLYLFIVRFIQGASMGAFMPLLAVLAARWAGATERGFLLGITFGGLNVGIFITNPLCAIICRRLGWDYIFYITGALGIVWCFASYFFIYDWPEEHPRISEEELVFLQKNRAVQPGTNSKKMAVPWKALLTSRPVNAVHFMNFCVLWGLLTITMCTPQFFKEILKMDVRTNGILTSVPFLGMLIVHIFSGSVFDAMRRQNWCTVTNLRKIYNTLGVISYVVSVPLMSIFSCTDNTIEIVSVFLGMSFLELTFTGGYLYSVFELAPRFAGIISGISNTFGVLPGFLCPILAALLTPNGTREEWLLVFYISVAIICAGGIAYLIFGSAELQPWAALKPKLAEEAEMEELKAKSLIVNDDTNENDEKDMF